MSGAKPTRIDHRDRDLHRSFGNTAPSSFPIEFLVDPGITMPNQNMVNAAFKPPVPAMPYGCTNYGQSEMATILDGVKMGIKNPAQLDAVTLANARHGIDIRESLLACTPHTYVRPERLNWIGNFYNIRSSGIIDSFDAFRLAQVSGLPEQRAITWGTPWFPSWERAIFGIVTEANGTYTNTGAKGQIVMPMPTGAELSAIRKDPRAFPWHNSMLDGWTTREGKPVYRDKAWMGPDIGEGGYIYFPREVVNMVMTIPGSVAYTVTNQTPEVMQTIDVNAVQWIISLFMNLYAKAFGAR